MTGTNEIAAIDATTHQVTKRAATGPFPDRHDDRRRWPDVLAIDPARRRLYAAAESGNVDLVDIAAGPAVKVGSQHVNNDAHSVAVDPDTYLVYFPLANVDGHPVRRIFH